MLDFRRSLRTRLILGAAIWIFIALAVSGFVLSGILREIVTANVDHDIFDHEEELTHVIDVDADGIPFVRQALSDPRFAIPRSGLYWQIARRNGATARSQSLAGATLHFDRTGGSLKRPTIIEGPTGTLRFLQREFQPLHLGEPLLVGVGADQRLIDDAMTDLNKTLASSLGTIAIGLLGAAIAQVVFGLLPLARVRGALAAIRGGKSHRMPEDFPKEVAALAVEMNALIAANDDMVRRARAQAGNLGHALKTPLAILMDEGRKLAENGQRDAGRLVIQQCLQMQRQVDYQMARARAAARVAPRAAAPIGPAVRSVIAALSRLYKQRAILFELTGPEDLRAACDPDDLSEIVGNVIDNAAKWARTRVHITISSGEGTARIRVEDDGPGIPPESRDTVFGIGERLDERVPGSGLGLSITRDLVTLYGGRVWLETSMLGGVAACLELPAIAP